MAQANTARLLLNKVALLAGGEIPYVAHVTAQLNVDTIQIVIRPLANVIAK